MMITMTMMVKMMMMTMTNMMKMMMMMMTMIDILTNRHVSTAWLSTFFLVALFEKKMYNIIIIVIVKMRQRIIAVNLDFPSITLFKKFNHALDLNLFEKI